MSNTALKTDRRVQRSSDSAPDDDFAHVLGTTRGKDRDEMGRSCTTVTPVNSRVHHGRTSKLGIRLHPPSADPTAIHLQPWWYSDTECSRFPGTPPIVS